MASKPIPTTIDTVIVGNGPSALILSYILHGHIPYYKSAKPHPDPILHRKLSASPCLLEIDIADLTAHFAASRLSYSTQALPVNVLLDTLLRPLADTEPEKYTSCVEWRFDEERKVDHVVLGNTAKAGGQWADNPVSASLDIGTLSYSEMVSLPGYTFENHYQKTRGGAVPDFYRPTRREVADYLASYPAEVMLEDDVHTNEEVGSVRRMGAGFYISSHNIACSNIVLASGTFSNLIPPRAALLPLTALPDPNNATDAPLLVVGSGFSAADVIIAASPSRKIIHIFKWDPEHNPSPLRACHPRAYPEYASVYRHMKQAARDKLGPQHVISPMRNRKSNPFFKDRDWDEVYEGLPNTYIQAVQMHEASARIILVANDGSLMERETSNMEYVIGRRGSLAYLDDGIARQIDRSRQHPPLNRALISGKSLRPGLEQTLNLAPNVFVIGSLTGDSLIRFAYGACIFAASEIIASSSPRCGTPNSSSSNSSMGLSTTPSSPTRPMALLPNGFVQLGGHADLHLDKKAITPSMDHEIADCDMWQDTS